MYFNLVLLNNNFLNKEKIYRLIVHDDYKEKMKIKIAKFIKRIIERIKLKKKLKAIKIFHWYKSYK